MIVINRCHRKYFLFGTEQSDFEFPLNVCKCSPTDLEEGKDVACCCLAPLMFLSGNGLAQKCNDVPDYDEQVIFPNERRVKKTQVSFDFFFSAIKQLHVRVNSFYVLIRCYILIEYRSMLACPRMRIMHTLHQIHSKGTPANHNHASRVGRTLADSRLVVALPITSFVSWIGHTFIQQFYLMLHFNLMESIR